MHGDMLRPFAANAPHQFAEASLGVLKQPMTRNRRGFDRERPGVCSILVILTRLSQFETVGQYAYKEEILT